MSRDHLTELGQVNNFVSWAGGHSSVLTIVKLKVKRNKSL